MQQPEQLQRRDALLDQVQEIEPQQRTGKVRQPPGQGTVPRGELRHGAVMRVQTREDDRQG